MVETEELSEQCGKILMKMERFHGKAKEEDQGAVALVLDLAKVFERVSLPVVRAWATQFSFPRRFLRVLCAFFEHQRRVQFEGCVEEPLQTIPAILPGSKWSCLLLRSVLQDALSEVLKIHPPLKLKVFVDDITAMATWRQVRGLAGALMCETRDQGIKWPYWHMLVFSDEVKIDMRHVCPKDVKKCLCRGPDQCTGKSLQPSMSMKS